MKIPIWPILRLHLKEHFGTITGAAAHFKCTTEALRRHADCPKVAEKLKAWLQDHPAE